MEKATVKKLVEIRKALRKKLLELKRGIIDESSERGKILEPLTGPLNKILDRTAGKRQPFLDKNEHFDGKKETKPDPIIEVAEQEVFPEFLPIEEEAVFQHPAASSNRLLFDTAYKTAGHIAEPYIRLLYKPDKSRDVTYGLTTSGNDIMMGAMPVRIHNNEIDVGDAVFTGTSGLFELLTKKEPMGYTEEDLSAYADILNLTNAHKSTKTGKIKASHGIKYSKIIKPLFNQAQTKIGKGYKYWDSPDELVDRLRLLYASSSAGNGTHQNEIISIIEELREAEIIH